LPLELRDVPGLPDPNVRPPTVAEPGDPFAALRVAHLLARSPRGTPVRLRDLVDRLNVEYLDWSFSRAVVAAVAVQLQSNWIADFRTQLGFELTDGAAGDELTIEDSARVESWLIRQVERLAAACQLRLSFFAKDEGAVP
jgi:hypothetical protein